MAVEIPTELYNFLRTEEERAKDASLDDQRAAAIRAYRGEVYGDEEEGRSQAVTRDVSEVIDFLGVGILGVIMAGGKAVEFETEPEQVPAVGPDGQPQIGEDGQPVMREADYGAEATAAVQYQFFRKQNGYRVLHDSLKAGLLEKTGIVKTYPEPQPPKRITVEVDRAFLDESETGTVFQGQPIQEATPIDPDWQPGVMSQMWRVSYDQPQPPIVRDGAVPNEWFRATPDAVELDEAAYIGEIMPVTISTLVGMGYDLDEVKALWDNAPAETVVERARDTDRTQTRFTSSARQGAERQLWLNIEYPLFDLNGDGIAERLFVHRIGQTVLKVMEVDEQPYSGWSPIPMQHRFVGESMADKTMDVQRIRSVLLRQGLDSLYLSNAPRTSVPVEGMTEDTIDDLLTVRPGALIRYRGGQAPTPFVTNDTSPTAFQAMEMMSAERESRTGITRQSQGLNPDAMNKTASGMAMLQANSDQIELYVTRNFAEGIVASIFAKRYRLMRAHIQPFRMKVDGKYQTIDPSKWPEEMDMAINVGLGAGSKDQRMAFRAQLLGVQQQIIAGGLPIVGPKQIYNNIRALVEDASLGVTTDYVLDPDTLGPQPEKPDPEAAKVQADAAAQQQKEQNAHEQAMTRLQLQQQEQWARQDLDRQSSEYDLQAKREKNALDVRLAQEKADTETQLALRRQNFEMELAERQFQFQSEMARRKEPDAVTSYRPGGALNE